jgi:hypothetical protein
MMMLTLNSFIAICQPPPPAQHDDLGRLQEPQLFISAYEGVFWTYDFVPDLNDCAQSITFKTFITITPLEDDGTFLDSRFLSFINTDWGGNENVNVGAIRQLAGLNANQAFNLTHVSMRVIINGKETEIDFYPGQNIKVKTGLPAPCDCLGIFFDEKKHKIYTGFGYNCN